MHFLWALIVGAIIGAIAGAITSKGKSMGWFANIIAGLVGSAIGEGLLGHLGATTGRNGFDSINYRGNYCCCRSLLLCWQIQRLIGGQLYGRFKSCI